MTVGSWFLCLARWGQWGSCGRAVGHRDADGRMGKEKKILNFWPISLHKPEAGPLTTDTSSSGLITGQLERWDDWGCRTPKPVLMTTWNQFSLVTIKNRLALKNSLSRQNQFSHTNKLNLGFIARLTWSGSFLAYASGNHQQNFSCFPKLIWGNH